jgi:hypothetical protein
LESSEFEAYKKKVSEREKQSYRKFNDMFIKSNLIVLKDSPPFTEDQEIPVLLNPLARTTSSGSGSYSFPKVFPSAVPIQNDSKDLASNLVKEIKVEGDGIHGVGTDVEMINSVPQSQTFLERNFTAEEREYCNKSADPRAA